MPVSNNGVLNISIGRDVSVVLTVAGQTIDLQNVTGFEASPQYANLRVDRLDGTVLNAELPKGWTGRFALERANDNLDAFFAQAEALWLSGGTLQNGTITQANTEADGSTSRYQFTNCALKFGAQNWKPESPVAMEVSFVATQRVAL
jgi:hypothetical protein